MSSFRGWRWGCAVLGLTLCAALAVAQEEGGGKRRRAMNEEEGGNGGGPGGGRGRKMLEQMQEKMLENLPGASEILAAHKEKEKALQEKIQSLRQEMREKVQAAADDTARKTTIEEYKSKIRAVASDMFDERIAFKQKILDLEKQNKEKILDQIENRAKEMRGKMMERHGKKNAPGGAEGGEAPVAGGGEEGPFKHGGATTPVPPDDNFDVAKALEQALQ